MQFNAVKRFLRPAQEVSWVFVGQIAYVVGAVAMVRVISEYLDPNQYGQVALALTLVALINQALMGGLTNGIGRYYSIAVEKKSSIQYLRASLRLIGFSVLISLIISVSLLALMHLIGYQKFIFLIISAIILSIFSGFNAVCAAVQNAARKRAVVAIHGAADAWLKIILAVVMVSYFGQSSSPVVAGFALSSIVVFVSNLIFVKKLFVRTQNEIVPGQSWVKQIWSFSWPFSLFGVFTWFQQASDRWALQYFVSEHEVGLYAVVFQLGFMPISIFLSVGSNFLLPILYQRSGSTADINRNREVHKMAWIAALISLLMTLVIFIIALMLHEWIFSLAVAEEYGGVSHYLPWVVLAGGFFSSGQMLSLKLMSEMRPLSLTIAKIVTAIIGIILNVFGAIEFGLPGVVGSLLIFSVVFFIWVAWIARTPIISERKL